MDDFFGAELERVRKERIFAMISGGMHARRWWTWKHCMLFVYWKGKG